MSILILTPDRNTPHRKADYVGAFHPESLDFEALHGGTVVRIDQSQPAAGRFRQTLHAIEAHAPSVLVYFGHGLRHSLPQLGATLGNVASLAGALALAGTAPLVVLYACSAADGESPGGEGGYCDALRDALCVAEADGVRVLGHATAGHTTRNPHVREFSCVQRLGGDWIVAPGSALWSRWRAELAGPFRFRFPFLTTQQIRIYLEELA